MEPLHRNQSEISTPVNRIRWATRREDQVGGSRRRRSILRRFHRRKTSGDQSRTPINATPNTNGTANTSAAGSTKESRSSNESTQSTQTAENRTVYFNLPLPDEARDENGHPKQHYARNKIRTAKYTPISFIPKNLWYQFHNVANLYFLFIIILGVSYSSIALNLTTKCSSGLQHIWSF
jgi:phospholipid-translocating ATPase